MHSFKYDVSAFFVFCGAGLLTGDCLELLYEHDIKKGSKKAGDGNRTHVSSLEGWCSTIELHPHRNI